MKYLLQFYSDTGPAEFARLPQEEQDAIVSTVRAELARHDGLIAHLRMQIEKLREYRQTLISAAVTGQIPVREEVPA